MSRQPSWKLIIAGREYDHTEKELMGLLQKYQLVDSVQLVSQEYTCLKAVGVAGFSQ